MHARPRTGLTFGLHAALIIALVAALVPVLAVVVAPHARAGAAAPGDLVINEILQNPSAVGDSAGEWFEVYNTTGAPIDMTGFVIEDDDADSHTIASSVVVPAGGHAVLGNNANSTTNGGVTVDYQYSGFQLANGGDEVVILDGATEIDRVNWDGGPSFPDPTGASMSLIATTLDNNMGANWCTASTPFGDGDLGTPGAVNDCGGGGGGLSPGDLVINEIIQNPAAVSDANGEWFEVFNATAGPVDLNGLTIKDDGTNTHTIGSSVVVVAGDFAVLGIDDNITANGGVNVDYEYSSFALGNGGDEVVILDGGVEIDRVNWDDGATFPDPTGASMSLIATALDNNDGANWCTASTPFGAGDLGTPGAANDCTGPGGLSPGDLVINEILQNPSAVSDTNGEWFEVFNNTGAPIDLIGLTIEDDDFDSHIIGSSVVVAAGGFAVLGRDANFAANGGVNVDYQYSSFFLSNSADEVVIRDGGVEIDRVNYDGGATFPDPTGASMSLDEVTNNNNDGANWCTASTPFGAGDLGTPGAANDCPLPPDLGVCGDGLETPIHVIQGSGSSSPEAGQFHVIEGVVVGDFQGVAGLNGFFVQEEDADSDGDATTSDGIFVDDGSFGVDVNEDGIVRVRGIVNENFGQTEITGVLDVVDCSLTDTVTAATVTFPVAAVSELESTEGMLVTVPQALHVSGNFNQARFGEVDLSVFGPLDNPTNIVAPGAPANLQADLNSRSRIQLDDGSNIQNPSPLPPYLGVGNTLRTGDTIPGLTAVLGYSFGAYEMHPQDPSAVNFTRVNVRPTGPPSVDGSMTVAAYNVLNYFLTLDTGNPICGPSGTLGCRGADNADELERQRAKLVAALSKLDADVVGLIELENPAVGDAPIADLVAGVNAIVGAGTYDYIATGAIGTDAIRVGIIYKPAAVTPVGPFAILDSSVNPLFLDTKNRPALAQTFQENGTDDLMTIAVNHLKSKGSPCDDVGDPDADDGQGNCNGTRDDAAQALVDWLATDPTGSGSGDFLITGDLNAYAQEDPVNTIEAGGYTDNIEAFLGTGYAAGAYSFNFTSESGSLDHALTSASLTSRVTDADHWHINADEPRGLDYNDFNQPGLYAPDEFRSSDHDPIIMGICETTAPVVDVTASPDSLWPPNHKYRDVATTVDVTDADPNATVTLVSVTSDEPDSGQGKGDKPNDIVIVDDFNFQLRAERAGGGDGRVYTITYEVTDSCGNSAIATATVTVPHDQS